ncbi:FUN14 family protein [Nitzschia inconspicua]|uniref:FUN14 family protein n=1 Tax=Nitzschia inconspicua TaxID=303405 RepID=A0A9K3KGK7_9STRA|nr:FUN14 family protein [Nitzschia inconspicua]
MVENKEDPTAKALDTLKPYVTQLSFGSVMGFCSGYALKKVGKAAAVVVGCGFIALQTCVSFGYLKIDWARLSEDAQKKLDKSGDGKLDMEDAKIYWQKLKILLTENLPSSSGFSLGFLLGVKSG